MRANTTGALSMPSKSARILIKRIHLPIWNVAVGPRSWLVGCARKQSERQVSGLHNIKRSGGIVGEREGRHASASNVHCSLTKSNVLLNVPLTSTGKQHHRLHPNNHKPGDHLSIVPHRHLLLSKEAHSTATGHQCRETHIPRLIARTRCTTHRRLGHPH